MGKHAPASRELDEGLRRFGYIKDWVEKKVRRHMMRSRKRKGFGWKRWSRQWMHAGKKRTGIGSGQRVTPKSYGIRPLS
jgi:hypothetical protein